MHGQENLTSSHTYLMDDVINVSTSHKVPPSYDYCIGYNDALWDIPLPTGNAFPPPTEFANPLKYSGFPLYPPQPSYGLLTLPHRRGENMI